MTLPPRQDTESDFRTPATETDPPSESAETVPARDIIRSLRWRLVNVRGDIEKIERELDVLECQVENVVVDIGLAEKEVERGKAT